jgi:hypothetical protein
LKSLGHQGIVYNLALLLAQSLWVGAPIIGYLVYRELSNTKRLLVWLRRFRPGHENRIRFHRCLGSACAAIAAPITIQDRSFTTSIFSSALRIWLLIPLQHMLWLLGFLLILAVLSPLRSSVNLIMITLCVWTVIYYWGGQIGRRMGFTTLTGRGGNYKAIRGVFGPIRNFNMEAISDVPILIRMQT